MKLVVCRLPEDQHEGLRRLAFEQKTSVAELIRRAIAAVYREDLEDISDMEDEIARYRADPSTGIAYGAYRAARASRVQS